MKNPDRCFQLYWLTDQICLTVLSMDNLTKLDKVTASHSRLIVDGTIIFTAYFLGCCNYTTGLSFILAVKKMPVIYIIYIQMQMWLAGALWFYSLCRSQLTLSTAQSICPHRLWYCHALCKCTAPCRKRRGCCSPDLQPCSVRIYCQDCVGVYRLGLRFSFITPLLAGQPVPFYGFTKGVFIAGLLSVLNCNTVQSGVNVTVALLHTHTSSLLPH